MGNRPKLQADNLDGNIYAILGAVRTTLRRHGKHDEAKEVSDRVLSSGSYHEALAICNEYVDFQFGYNDEGEDDE